MIRRSIIRAAAAFVLSVSAASAVSAQNTEDRNTEDPVIAIINGKKINLSAVRDIHRELPAQYQALPLEQLYEPLLRTIIDTELTAQDALKKKIDQDPAYLAELERAKKRLLERTVINQLVEKEVTDAAVARRYEERKKEFASDEEVRARHILLKTEDEAKAVIGELDKGGDFAALAREKSTGPSGRAGGDLGFFAKGSMVPEFEAAAFDLTVGKYTERPVQTQFGWHVIQLDERRKSVAPPFAELEAEIRQELTQAAGQKYLAGLRKAATIQKFNVDGSPKQ